MADDASSKRQSDANESCARARVQTGEAELINFSLRCCQHDISEDRSVTGSLVWLIHNIRISREDDLPGFVLISWMVLPGAKRLDPRNRTKQHERKIKIH
jgi:hypothetical protein